MSVIIPFRATAEVSSLVKPISMKRVRYEQIVSMLDMFYLFVAYE